MHSVSKAKYNALDKKYSALQEENARLKSSCESAWKQSESAQKQRNAFGLQLDAALKGQKRSDEPEGDLRLDAVRRLVKKARVLEEGIKDGIEQYSHGDGYFYLKQALKEANELEQCE